MFRRGINEENFRIAGHMAFLFVQVRIALPIVFLWFVSFVWFVYFLPLKKQDLGNRGNKRREWAGRGWPGECPWFIHREKKENESPGQIRYQTEK